MIYDVIQSLVVLIEKFPKTCKNCQYGWFYGSLFLILMGTGNTSTFSRGFR